MGTSRKKLDGTETKNLPGRKAGAAATIAAGIVGGLGAILGGLIAGSSPAQAGILSPGVYMVSQDLGFATANSTWIDSTRTELASYFGGDKTRANYYNGATTVRAGFDYGLMADVRLNYQWNTLNTPNLGFSSGQKRGGLQYVHLGLMKQIASVSPNEKASFFPSSSIGDIEVFGGVYIPTRSTDKLDFLTPYEGVFKAEGGLRHTYYGSLVNFETAVGGTYRNGYPTQGFAQVIAPIHWESCPIEWFRYSPLKPSLSYLHTFGGYDSTIAPDFLADWSSNGNPPIWKVHSKQLIAGLEFMHPFSYTFFASIHYNMPVYTRNNLQFSEAGINLSYLF
jgi:hypothetical protein